MSDERIDPKVVEAAAKAAHEAERQTYIDSGEAEHPTWDECVADSTVWGGENFTLEEVLGFQEAAIRAADRERGLKEERITHFIEEDYENESGRWVDGGRARLVSDYYDSPRQGQVERGEATAERRGVCGRIMVGSGTDTYDPVCELPKGHDGMCKSSSAIDQHRLGRQVEQGRENG